MPVIAENLSVWDISHRWASCDPDTYRFKHPLLVKDYFRLLIGAILNGELFSETLILAKRPPDSKADPSYYLKFKIDDIYACLAGKRYSRNLLQKTYISRYDFQEWCHNLNIELPEFWFPTGWNYSFNMPENGTRALWVVHMEPEEYGGVAIRFEVPEPDEQLSAHDFEEGTLRVNQRAKRAAQQFASDHWKQFPDSTIADIIRSEVFLSIPDVSHYGESAHRKWVSQVAPLNIKGKRGRPKSTKSDEDLS